jgi:hypothetical protein
MFPQLERAVCEIILESNGGNVEAAAQVRAHCRTTTQTLSRYRASNHVRQLTLQPYTVCACLHRICSCKLVASSSRSSLQWRRYLPYHNCQS